MDNIRNHFLKHLPLLIFWAWFVQMILPFSLSASTNKAHCILEREREEITVNADGTYTDVDEIFLKVLDEKGKRQQQVQSFFLNKNYSRLRITAFELIHPDGRKSTIDWKANSRVTNPAQTTRMNIYDPNQKVIRIFIPGLSIGDTIHYKVVVENFKPMIGGEFFGNAVLQHTFPAKKILLKITLPAKKPLYHLLKDKCPDARVSLTKRVHGKNRTYQWKFEDVEELVPEPGMPETSRVAMRLLFSTMKTWKKVSRWYYNLSEPKLKPTKDIVAKVKELTKSKKDQMEKASALFFFVSRKIRYMGLIEEAKRPGFEPHQVGLTFKRRYGVCRDKAALLVSMLRIAGFNAVPVLIKAGGKLDPEIPVPYFNHAICAILDKSGRPKVFMDPTSETSKQFLPDYEQDSSCLPATKDGSDLILTPVNPPSKNFFVMSIRDTLNENGSLSGKVSVKTGGFIDTAFRSILMSKTRDEQKRFLKGLIRKRRPGVKVKNLSWTDPGDTKTPFFFGSSFEIKDALDGGRLYLLSLSRQMGLLDSWIISKASMTKRRYPLRLGYAVKTVIKEEMDIQTRDMKYSLPNVHDIVTPHFAFTTNFSVCSQKLLVEREFVNKALEIPPKAYPELLRLQAELLRQEYLPILVKKEAWRDK